MKQTKKKKPRVFRTLIWCIHNNAKMTKNIDDEKPATERTGSRNSNLLSFSAGKIIYYH